MTVATTGIEFQLPDSLAAHEPPEGRGLPRDWVRMMVSRVSDDDITHSTFRHLPDFLAPGDLLVVNNSATVNAAFHSLRQSQDGTRTPVMVHLSTPLSSSRWVIELRRDSPKGSSPLLDAEAGETFPLPEAGAAVLVEPYTRRASPSGGVRLWIAELSLPGDYQEYSTRRGFPIRYNYVPRRWPLSYYQSVFAEEPGSAEMPSAGRPFTREILQRLKLKGVRVAAVTLHTGVSSLDSDEDPFPERFRVSSTTARAVNETRKAGRRIVAVGTTVVRALETVASPDGTVRPSQGWTSLVVKPERGFHVVEAMLTGFHAPKASHLSMLEALAGHDHLARAYESALRERYAWHEFGDLHLIL